ncbi:MAG: hypothetical protein HC904_09510 [Blastochloris sp.]|nr:hypothetical protein [Blastochloris sp.]
MKKIQVLVFLLGLCCVLTTTLSGQPMVEIQVEGGSQDNAAALQLRCLKPTEQQNIQGALVLILGSGMNGLHLAENPEWLKTSDRLGLIFVVAQFIENERQSSWHESSQGTGRMFASAWEKLGAETGRADWKKWKLYMVGLSTGGQFAYDMALSQPELMGGFVTLKGGHHRMPEPTQQLRVPGLLVIGETDMAFRRENLRQVYEKGRLLSAPWELLVDPGCGHASERVSHLIPPYLQSLLDAGKQAASWQTIKTSYLNSPDQHQESPLPWQSEQPDPLAVAHPNRLDLGKQAWNLASETAELRLQPAESSDWDEVRIVSLRKLLELSPSLMQRDSLRPVTIQSKALDRAIAGSWTDTLLFTYYKKGRQKLGLSRVPVSFRSQNNLSCTPPSLLLQEDASGTPGGTFTLKTSTSQLTLTRLQQDPPQSLQLEKLSETATQQTWQVRKNSLTTTKHGTLSLICETPVQQEILIHWFSP